MTRWWCKQKNHGEWKRKSDKKEKEKAQKGNKISLMKMWLKYFNVNWKIDIKISCIKAIKSEGVIEMRMKCDKMIETAF